VLDGRPTAELQYGDLIKVRRGVHTFRLITMGNTNFYDAFRTKFNFQIRPDAIPSRRNTAVAP
jgi:NAD+ kinase